MIELKTYKMVDEKYCTDCVCVIPSEVYLKKDADKAIEELNKKLMPCLNGDCILTCEVVEKYGKENAELKQKLEDAKATAYAESVDAGMANKKLQDELTKLKAQMPEYKQFIKDKNFKKELVDEYDGYVYEWAGHRYIATPYINIFIKGILRTLYKALANWAVCEMDYWRKCLEHYEDYFNVRTDEDLTEEKCERMIDNWRKVAHNCRAKAEEYK